MRKQSAYDSEKGDITKTEQDIVCLFPSLDISNPQNKGNARERVKTYLKVLKTLADITVKGRDNEAGYITKYDLTQGKGFPRVGGGTAQEVLIELEGLKLLTAYKTENKKKTLMIKRRLTAKGVIACMAFTEFQKTDKLAVLLQNGQFQGDKLATLLGIHNAGYGQRRISPEKTQISPCIEVIKKIGAKSKIESMTEDFIIKEFRTTEEEDFMKQINQPLAKFMFSSLEESRILEAKEFLQSWVSLIDLSGGLKSEDVEQVMNLSNRMVLTMLSPEFLAWMMTKKRSKDDIEQKMKQIKYGLTGHLSADSPLDNLDYCIVAWRDLMLEELSQP